MKKIFFVLLSFAIAITACNQNNKTEETSNDDIQNEVVEIDGDSLLNVDSAFADEHTAENSLDYWGTYKGVLPCADCEGIEAEIVLTRDGTYTIKYTYLGKKSEPYVEKGDYRIKGNYATLEESNGNITKYFVSENYIKQLDADGKEVTGVLANKYILKKEL